MAGWKISIFGRKYEYADNLGISEVTFRLCEHNSPEEMKEMCEFFKIDTKDCLHPDLRLRLLGMTRELFLYQASAVRWM